MKTLNQIIEMRPVGYEFYYLGMSCVVTKSRKQNWWRRAKIVADYIDPQYGCCEQIWVGEQIRATVRPVIIY